MEPDSKRQKLTLPTDVIEQSSSLKSNDNTIFDPESQLTVFDVLNVKASLLSLPIDIRMVIYDFVFGNARITMIRDKRYYFTTPVKYEHGLCASILLVNKQIHCEALPFFKSMEITLIMDPVKYTHQALWSLGKLPAQLQAQITIMELSIPIKKFDKWWKSPSVNFPKLRKISLRHRVCHIKEDDRPIGDSTEIEECLWDLMEKKYDHELITRYNWHPNNSLHQFDDVFVVWILNTRRDVTNGWVCLPVMGLDPFIDASRVLTDVSNRKSRSIQERPSSSVLSRKRSRTRSSIEAWEAQTSRPKKR